MTKDEAWSLANHWAAAWNAHDLDLIMTHYEDAIELISPVAARLLETPDGKVAGKANLRAYFQRGLEAYPELHFHIEDVLWGINSIVLYYTNQTGKRTAEFMELSASGKVRRVVANYNPDKLAPKLSDRMLEIGGDCAPRLKEPLRSADHGDILYDENGLPK